MKKQSGITLISLVVTIIVLIILAGISINLILGQDGIINKAKEAKQNMEYAQIEEQEQLNEVYEYLELGTIGSGLSNDKIEEIASKYQTLKNQYDALQEDYKNQNVEYTNFKTTIAEAITEKGIETSENADAETMANNIRNLSLTSPEPNITAFAYNGENPMTGTWSSSNSALICRQRSGSVITFYSSGDGNATLKYNTVPVKSGDILHIKYSYLQGHSKSSVRVAKILLSSTSSYSGDIANSGDLTETANQEYTYTFTEDTNLYLSFYVAYVGYIFTDIYVEHV